MVPLVSNKCHGKKPVPYFLPAVVFSALSTGLSVNSEDSLGEDLDGYGQGEGLTDKLRASKGPATSDSSPSGPSSTRRKAETLFHQSPVFLFQGLTVAPFFYMLIKK